MQTVDRKHRMLSVFWLTLMATSGTLLATQQVWIVLLVALIGSSIACVISIVWKSSLRLNYVLITNTLAMLLLLSILNSVYNFTKWTYLMIPASLIWIVLAVISDFRFVVKIFVVVFSSQTVLLTAKIDEIVEISWSTSVFPSAATVVLIYITSILLLVTLLVCIFKGKP